MTGQRTRRQSGKEGPEACFQIVFSVPKVQGHRKIYLTWFRMCFLPDNILCNIIYLVEIEVIYKVLLKVHIVS